MDNLFSFFNSDNMVQIMLSWLLGKAGDSLLNLIPKSEIDVKTDMLEIIYEAAQKTFKECGVDEWDSSEFKARLLEKTDNLVNINLTDTGIKNLILENRGETMESYITDDWLKRMKINCIEKVSENTNICNYIILYLIMDKREKEEQFIRLFVGK